MMDKKQFLKKIAALTVIFALADQATKLLAAAYLRPQGRRGMELIDGFLRLVYVENKGVAFSFLGGLDPSYRVFLIAGAQIAVMALLVWLALKEFAESKVMSYALPLILGGAAGNLVDRLRLGRVIDFVEMDLGFMVWPVYNLADVFITAGVLLWLVDALRTRPDSPR